MKRLLVITIIFVLLLIIIRWFRSQKSNMGKLQRTELNYGKEVNELAKHLQLPAAYFKALIALECSGLKDIPPRFEPHIYTILKQVKRQELDQFEFVCYDMIKDADNEALKNLARSWGPFQIMGYKCLLLGINIQDLRGEECLYWGMKWINLTYGNYLRKKRFQDAFHIHNTGEKYPKNGVAKTYDPNYVKNGMQFIAYYQRKKTIAISLSNIPITGKAFSFYAYSLLKIHKQNHNKDIFDFAFSRH